MNQSPNPKPQIPSQLNIDPKVSSIGHLKTITALSLVALALGSCASPTPTAAPAPPASHRELARHYAPVIRQGVASDQDYITAVDFV